ncbi:MAG: WG repeat-containing protein [Nostoc sp. DedQUE09]|nr:WG repeat-containing protein [Nostoc sp. DedQUE09]MDZ7954830.1 WG repeat-containing protein [Nostoc sp. DedQUE09]
MDKTGKFAIPLQFEGATDFAQGLARVWVNQKWSYIDKTGKFAIPPQFDYAANFSEGLPLVSIENQYSLKVDLLILNG